MGRIIVVGLGEVGRPLLEVVSQRYDAIGIDVEGVPAADECEIMHVCYPFAIADFIGQTVAYVERYRPHLTIINSTVAPGTTRTVHQATGAPIVHSPVRGKHFKMKEELLRYTKFVGGIDRQSAQRAAEHLESLSIKTRILASPEATELAKLTETTYFGLMIAWAQEVERYCDTLHVDYDEIVSFYTEIGFFPPVKYFPGAIGGHCVLPNITILKSRVRSEILDAIESSNQSKLQRDSAGCG